MGEGVRFWHLAAMYRRYTHTHTHTQQDDLNRYRGPVKKLESTVRKGYERTRSRADRRRGAVTYAGGVVKEATLFVV